MRNSLFVVVLAVTAWGCEKDGGSSNTPPATVPAAMATTGSSAARDDKVEHTHVLDFDLVTHGNKYTLRDGAYEITFAARPDVTGDDQAAPDGTKLHTATALAAKGENELVGFFVMPIPKGVPYDTKVGLDGARDQSVAKINGTITSEVPTKLGSLDARKVTATASAPDGRPMQFTEYLAFDDKHYVVVGAILISFSGFTAFSTDAIASFVVKPGDGPPAGNGK